MDLIVYRESSCGFSKYSDIAWITAKATDVPIHPLNAEMLIYFVSTDNPKSGSTYNIMAA